jgi:hypothetical protein
MIAQSPPRTRRLLSPSVRRAVLTAHVVVSVGLLGDSAGFTAVAIRAAGTDDPDLARASYELLNMFSVVFGIPLSFAAILTGLTLAIGSKWGVLRYPWVTGKLLLIVSVMLVGTFVIGPGLGEMLDGDRAGDAAAQLIGAGAYDVLALTLATGLSVYKPGRARRGRQARRRIALPADDGVVPSCHVGPATRPAPGDHNIGEPP